MNRLAAYHKLAPSFRVSPRAKPTVCSHAEHLGLVGLGCFLFFYAGLGFAQPATNIPGPRIAFDAPVYDFGRVKSGELVKHTYTFTNTGSRLLEITNVQPSCGCTAAGEWTRRAEPGQTGTIPIQLNTAGFGGEVLKTITVSSTDEVQPTFALQLKGTVWKPIDVLPTFAVLNIMPDATSASTLVKILNNTDEYISISSPPKSSTNAFTAEIRTNQPGKEFQVEIKAVPPFEPGNSRGAVTVTTTSTNMPLVSIGVWSIVQPKLAVIPAQVTLPPSPLTAGTSTTVTIQDNSTNMVTISDPSCSLTNVDLALKEVIAGRAYTVTLGFPSGFEIHAGDTPVLTVKTSLPELPLLKIQITQLPQPANTVSAAAVSAGSH